MQTREKTLLLILGVAIFAALNLLGLNLFLKGRATIKKQTAAARAELATDRSWIDLNDALQPADAWIESHAMRKQASEEASAELLKTEREEAEKAGLKIAEESLLPVQQTPYGSAAPVSVKLNGPFPGVVKLLFALQSPTAWRTIEKLSIKSDAQPPNVIADLEIRQYFQPASASEEASPKP
jgi:hypothetical protein